MPAKRSTRKPATPSASKTRSLRIAFIGSGGIANTHMEYLKPMNDVEIVAACDIKTEALDRVHNNFAIPGLYKDWKEMLRKEQIDAVSVCTPNYLHCQPTIDALNAGCHVLVEKPLAMNAREGQRMLDAAKKNRKHLVIGFQYRFGEKTQMIKRAVENKTLGDIIYARVRAIRRRGIPNWGVFGQKHLQGGGPMIDIGVHAIEMCHYAMGCPKPVAASGQTWTYLGDKPSDVVSQWPNWDYKTYTVEDLATGLIRFSNGSVMHIEAMFAGHIKKGEFSFELMGTKGGANYSDAELYFDRDGTMFNASADFLPKIDAFQVKLRKFVDTALYNVPSDAPIEHGLAVQKILDAVYQSAKLGKEVKIN